MPVQGSNTTIKSNLKKYRISFIDFGSGQRGNFAWNKSTLCSAWIFFWISFLYNWISYIGIRTIKIWERNNGNLACHCQSCFICAKRIRADIQSCKWSKLNYLGGSGPYLEISTGSSSKGEFLDQK